MTTATPTTPRWEVSPYEAEDVAPPGGDHPDTEGGSYAHDCTGADAAGEGLDRSEVLLPVIGPDGLIGVAVTVEATPPSITCGCGDLDMDHEDGTGACGVPECGCPSFDALSDGGGEA